MQSKLQLTSLAALAHVSYRNVFARSRGMRNGEKAEGWSHLNLSSLLSLRAIPALWLALQKTIGAVLFPGRKHLGQVIKAACARRSLAASSFQLYFHPLSAC